MLEDLTDGVDLRNGELVVAAIYSHTYTYLLANLLVDDDVHQSSRRRYAVLGCDELFEREQSQEGLDCWLASVKSQMFSLTCTCT